MHRLFLALLAASTLAAPRVYAASGATCDDKLLTLLHECERIVGSLRPDKAGQMRVFASDGSMFSAAQAQWMKEQLQRTAQDCAEGDSQQAARRLAEVQELLKEHRRAT